MSKKLQMILLVLGLSVVIAFTGCSSDDDDEPTVTAPTAPSNISATTTGPTTITVGWTASLDDAPDGYKVERRLAETDWDSLGSVAASVTTYGDNTVEFGSGTTYIYRVGAYNAGGTTYSGQATATAYTHNELLFGAWNAVDPSQLGEIDSASVEFAYQESLGGYIYRRYEYREGLDAEDIEEGTYDADGTEITWTAVRINGETINPPDVYTWNYSMETTGETMTVEYDWGTPFDVDYEKIPEPPVD
ncbi:fibronectin type III domain-containing protein [bacterium]|nr:fibronectin type III domain-containing protein [bacterium]